MWYFAGLVGLFTAATAGILMALWFEIRAVREREIATDPCGPDGD